MISQILSPIRWNIFNFTNFFKLLLKYLVHTRFNDNWLFVSFFYYCNYYFSLTFFNLILLFIKLLYNDLLNFSFCKCISSHPTSICSKLALLPGVLLFTLSISLNKFLLVEIPGTKHLTYLVIVDFTFKTCICACYIKKIAKIIEEILLFLKRPEIFSWFIINLEVYHFDPSKNKKI